MSRLRGKAETLTTDALKAKLGDADAVHIWKKAGKTAEVQVAQLLKAYEECLKEFRINASSDDLLLLQSFMGVKGGDQMTVNQFSDFLKTIGSIKASVPIMQRLAKEEWWCGWLSGEETTELLSGCPRGTYMARFTKSFPGCLAVTFVSPEAEIKSMIFQRTSTGLLSLKTEDPKANNMIQFPDLHAAITGFKGTLSVPFTTQLTKKDWFRENIADRAAAEDALAALKPGTFAVWQDPTTQNRFVISLASNPGGFVHTEVPTPSGDFRPNNAQNIPSSSSLVLPQEARARVLLHLQSHLRQNRHLLKYPIKTGVVPLLYLHGALRGDAPVEQIPPPEELKSSGTQASSGTMVGSPGTSPLSSTSGQSSSKEPLVVRLHARCDTTQPPSAIARLVVERYCVQQFHNWTLLAAADGVEEEKKNLEAATRAVNGFVESMKNQRQRVTDVVEAEHCLLRALNFAHSKIVEGKDPRYIAVGSATLLGGIVVELAEQDRVKEYRHAFVCANLGNWKAFVYSPDYGDTFVEVTADNRQPSVNQLRQPGGRVGAFIDNSKPDIKGLESYCELLHDGDIVLLLSDGVHANLDPRNLGKTPAEMGLQYASWADVPVRQFHTACRLFEANLLKRIALASRQQKEQQLLPTPHSIANALVDYTMQITEALRRHVADTNPAELPADRKQLPGWLGECTCVAIQVGRTKLQRDQHRLSLSLSAPALGNAAIRSSGLHGVVSGPLHSTPAAQSPLVNSSKQAVRAGALSSGSFSQTNFSAGSKPLTSTGNADSPPSGSARVSPRSDE